MDLREQLEAQKAIEELLRNHVARFDLICRLLERAVIDRDLALAGCADLKRQLEATRDEMEAIRARLGEVQ